MVSFKYHTDSTQTRFFIGSEFELLHYFPTEGSVLLVDEQVFNAHPHRFRPYHYILIPSGEKAKSFEVLQHILHQLIEKQADKNTLMVAVGGGATTDLGGFATSIYKRGARLALVPTTTLAMVDAAIGGKNGINFGNFKNQIGTVLQPEIILMDTDWLDSLPEQEWRQGCAEMIKHACIADENLFLRLSGVDFLKLRNDRSLLHSLIEQNVKLKMDIVVQDPFEKGPRKLLNFGHTIGHAIESCYRIPHGEAVAIGMCLEAQFAVERNELSESAYQQMVRLIEQYKFPVNLNLDPERIMQSIVQDKKRQGEQIDFILLKRIGHAEIHSISLSDLNMFLKNRCT